MLKDNIMGIEIFFHKIILDITSHNLRKLVKNQIVGIFENYNRKKIH